MSNDTRSPARKAISLTLGAVMALFGAIGFLWMLLFSGTISLAIWLIPIGAIAGGVAILYDDLKKS